jgi:hypothetical protein
MDLELVLRTRPGSEFSKEEGWTWSITKAYHPQSHLENRLNTEPSRVVL